MEDQVQQHGCTPQQDGAMMLCSDSYRTGAQCDISQC